MVPLAEPLDQFFKNVMVMDNDINLRNNRIQLLSGIVKQFIFIADFSKLQNG
jgi:glycyl-tRNA synthetase beta chain